MLSLSLSLVFGPKMASWTEQQQKRKRKEKKNCSVDRELGARHCAIDLIRVIADFRTALSPLCTTQGPYLTTQTGSATRKTRVPDCDETRCRNKQSAQQVASERAHLLSWFFHPSSSFFSLSFVGILDHAEPHATATATATECQQHICSADSLELRLQLASGSSSWCAASSHLSHIHSCIYGFATIPADTAVTLAICTRQQCTPCHRRDPQRVLLAASHVESGATEPAPRCEPAYAPIHGPDIPPGHCHIQYRVVAAQVTPRLLIPP